MKKHLIKLSMLALAVALIGTPAIVRAQGTGTCQPCDLATDGQEKSGCVDRPPWRGGSAA